MAVFGRVYRLANAMGDRMEKAYARLGIARGEFDVLATLRRSGEPYTLSPRQLSATLMLTTGGMTGRLDKLETGRAAQPHPRPARPPGAPGDPHRARPGRRRRGGRRRSRGTAGGADGGSDRRRGRPLTGLLRKLLRDGTVGAEGNTTAQGPHDARGAVSEIVRRCARTAHRGRRPRKVAPSGRGSAGLAALPFSVMSELVVSTRSVERSSTITRPAMTTNSPSGATT